MTLEDKRAAAVAYLRRRNRYVLDLRHTRARHERMMDKTPAELPPQIAKVRRIK